MKTKTVHLIANAHIDPVWLWNKQSGIDELLNTCETMVNLLDEYSDFRFTAAESFRLKTIERLNERLFSRIKEHVADGRWEIVGGWWLQPDCNALTYEGFYHQIKTGYDYMMEKFGFFPEIGYNVDSFGHSAILPKLMNEFGQKYYVFMRPGKDEFSFAPYIFNWQGSMGGNVTAFRIPTGYGMDQAKYVFEWAPQVIADLPIGVNHSAIFYGVGDHGGGPSTKNIEFIKKNIDSLDDIEVKFSTLKEFFKCLEADNAELETWKGDLQHHAIGCYSVKRDIKTKVRHAEQSLTQLGEVTEFFKNEAAYALEKGWQETAFAQFHDILGGTSIKSSYDAVFDSLGGAISSSVELLNDNLRKKIADFPPHKYQRIVMDNKSALEFSDYVEFEPWLPWYADSEKGADIFKSGNNIVDLLTGSEVKYQQVKSEQINEERIIRLLFFAELKQNEMRTLSMQKEEQTKVENNFTVTPVKITLKGKNEVDFVKGELTLSDMKIPLPTYELNEDKTDNWTHVIDRYPQSEKKTEVIFENSVLEEGPIRAAIFRHAKMESSQINEVWRVYGNGQYVELKLKVNWQEKQKILKYTIPFDLGNVRVDGIAGGKITRKNDGAERPFHYFTVLNDSFSIVSPDIFGFDVDEEKIRLTLLRNPVLTHHDPFGFDERYAVYADTGEHTFTIRFTRITDVKTLENMAKLMQRPLIIAETTRGMAK